MPVRWHNQEIIVSENVIISSPYRPEDCKAGKNHQDALGRVKRMLEGEKKKVLQEKERVGGGGTPPTGPRKGG